METALLALAFLAALSLTDWMYLTPNGAIMNRNKCGLKVAELVATMRPVQP